MSRNKVNWTTQVFIITTIEAIITNDPNFFIGTLKMVKIN